MAKIGFSTAQRVKSFSDIETLKFQHVDEKQRIVLFDNDMIQKWSHYIRSGEKKGRYYECLGDDDVLAELGRDNERCPACRVADPSRDATVPTPRRRLAMNVAVYRTGNGGKPIEPIHLDLKAWVFGPDKLNKLVDARDEYDDLTGRDIVLKCTSKEYQQVDVVVSPTNFWEKSKAATAILKDIAAHKNDQKALERLLCSPITAEAYERLLDAEPAYEEDESDEEITRTISHLRGGGLSDKAIQGDDDDDDDAEEDDDDLPGEDDDDELPAEADDGKSNSFGALVAQAESRKSVANTVSGMNGGTGGANAAAAKTTRPRVRRVA